MTGDNFKIELIKAKIKQKDLAPIFGVSRKTMNTVCNSFTVPKLYELALIGYLATRGNANEQN